MGKHIDIYCENLGRQVEVSPGETLLSVSQRLASELGFRAIAARVNNKNEALSYDIYRPKTVFFLPVTHPSGERAYIRSLCMVLYCAVHHCYPGARLVIEHSIARGYFCHLRGVECSPEVVADISREMRDLIRRDLPLERHEGLTGEVVKRFAAEGMDDKVGLLSSNNELYTTYYTLGDVSDSYYGTLAPSTGMLAVWALRPYKDGFLLLGFDHDEPDKVPAPIDQDKMYRAFTDYVEFNNIIGVSNVGSLNAIIARGGAHDLVNVAEALHEKALARISDEIAARYHRGGARIVLISGPSSSGKTTTTKRLGIHLMTNLLKPQLISLDDYFVDRAHTPRDASGDYDYESLYALDLEQFNADLNNILAGQEVEIPTYNFETGKREYRGNKVRLEDNSILLIEGIHGLNPQLTEHIPDEMKFRLYVSALTTISIDDHNWVPTTDNRLLRRIIRDHKFRGTDAVSTIKRWPSVRRGEEKWIFPYQENADAMFNSSLMFELSVIKDYAYGILRNVRRDIPEYAEAYRLMRFLGYFQPIDPSCVPSTSLLREFLGGSSFRY